MNIVTNFIVGFILGFFIFKVFNPIFRSLIERFTVTSINDKFPFVPSSIKIPDEALLFDSLLTYNMTEFPKNVFDNTKYTLYPYYQSFPYDIINMLTLYIKDRIKMDNSKRINKDNIKIIKKPYNVYYKGTDVVTKNFNYNREYVFTIDIENLTHFFVRSYIFNILLNNGNIQVLSIVTVNNDYQSFKFDTANNNNDVSDLNWKNIIN